MVNHKTQNDGAKHHPAKPTLRLKHEEVELQAMPVCASNVKMRAP